MTERVLVAGTHGDVYHKPRDGRPACKPTAGGSTTWYERDRDDPAAWKRPCRDCFDVERVERLKR